MMRFDPRSSLALQLDTRGASRVRVRLKREFSARSTANLYDASILNIRIIFDDENADTAPRSNSRFHRVSYSDHRTRFETVTRGIIGRERARRCTSDFGGC